MSRLFHLWAYCIPLLVAPAILWGGPWLWGPLLLITFLHPLGDRLLARLPGLEVKGSALSEAILLTYPLLQTLFLVAAILLTPSSGSDAWIDAILRGAILGMMTGALGITAAHELVHRGARWQRGLGVFLLSQVGYAHFRIEHVFGHHVRVATPEDPASARRGETVYAFWIRSIVTGFISAWRFERKRPLLRNRMVHYLVLLIAWGALSWAINGAYGLLLWICQAKVAVLLLELINYVEHYGIVRSKKSESAYQPVTVAHSWDSDHRLTNAFLFNLGRHSEHHLHPRKPFEKLINPVGAPVLPYGYSTMMLFALIPPLYFRLMDPRVEALGRPSSNP